MNRRRGELSPERKKVVILCAGVACMSGGPVLLRGHLMLMGVWVFVMLMILVYAMSLLGKLKKQGL